MNTRELLLPAHRTSQRPGVSVDKSHWVVVQAIAKLQGTDASTVLTRMILPHLDEHIVLAQELFEQGIIGRTRRAPSQRHTNR